MSLTDKITSDMKAALKSGEKLRLSCLRLLLSFVKNKAIELRKDSLDDAEVQGVITTLVRQRQDSVEQYRKGGREDLAGKEAEEMEILKGYLPPQLGPEEIRGLVRDAVAEAGAGSVSDMGRVMKLVMPRVKGRADGRQVQEIVREVLGG
ncbi:MAG: GatB/YqeY domain-containing protein [Thermodesulfobacteriota bacterium]